MAGLVSANRNAELAASLREASAALIATVEQVEPALWQVSPGPGVWSIGKEVEHICEAASYHQWIVRRTIGEKVPAKRPFLERAQMTTELSIDDAISLIRRRTDDGVALILGLSDAQLDLLTKPPRTIEPRLAGTIRAVLIGHYEGHRREIEAKLRAFSEGAAGR